MPNNGLPTPTASGAVDASAQRGDVKGPAGRTLWLQFVSVADDAPAWPSVSRDKYIERFWPTEPFLSGAIFSICSRNASFRWEVTGPRHQVAYAQKLLSQADFGRGWQSMIMKLSQDLITVGNGAWMEIIRPARARTNAGVWYDAVRAVNPDTGEYEWVPYNRHSGKLTWGMVRGRDFEVSDSMLDLPIGLAYMDSFRVERTGDPRHPGIYTDSYGHRHLLASHQVSDLTEMPSGRVEHLGYQRCAVDRAMRAAQIMRDTEIYKHEKISGRFVRKIYLTNVDADLIQDAVLQAEENNDNKGLLRYSQPIVASTIHPEAKASVESIELASMPDGFDEETSFRWYVAALALGLGVDYGFLAPLPGGRLGTGMQAETADRQARGKSSRLFTNMMERVINWNGILPCETVFRFNAPDPLEESERDRALSRRARSLSIFTQAGIITPEIAAQIASDSGDIAPQYLKQMGISDLTPIVTASGNDVMCPVAPREQMQMAVPERSNIPERDDMTEVSK